jgi:hypothetical protein
LFADPWPVSFPSRTKLQADLASYQSAYDAAGNGDKAAIKTRRKARGIMIDDLKTLAPYLESVAKAANDLSMLAETGYDVRQPNATNGLSPALVDPPAMTVQRSKVSGVILVTVTRRADAGAYEVQLATGDPAVEANWKAAVTSKKARNIEVNTLTPGTLYYVRARVIGSQGPGGWSDIANIMAV